MSINLDNLRPGTYVPSATHSTLIQVIEVPKKKDTRKFVITEPSITIRLRADFRSGMSYRALAKKYKVSIPTVRRCLRGDLYVSMIAAAEGLEPTLAAVNLVGLRSHLQVPNARANLDGYRSRQKTDEYTNVLTPEQKRARHAERTRQRRARLKAEAQDKRAETET